MCSQWQWVMLAAGMALAGLAREAAGQPAPSAPREGVRIERDVEYGRAGERPLRLDLLRPAEPVAERLPAIVWIHGGGWRAGDKSSGIPRLTPFVATGQYVGVSVGYRLTPEARWPAQIHDCKAAIRFLRGNAEKLGIDAQRIGVWGISAGGHLAALLGTSGDVAELEGENGSPGRSSRVACVVDFCGPSDFLAFARFQRTAMPPPGAAGSPERELFGGRIAERRAMAVAASPVTYASQDDPPFLIVHGTDDPLVPFDQGERMHAALSRAGAEAVLVRIDGGGHAIGGLQVQQRVEAFFARHLWDESVEVSAEPIRGAR